MHKLLLLLLVLFFGMNAQSQSITIKNDALRIFDSNLPYSTQYASSYGQVIYWESEIQGSGNINAITFYYTDSSLKHSDSLAIYMSTTNVDYFYYQNGIYLFKHDSMTKVFDTTLSNYTIPGAVTIPLKTPFYYNGVGNLVIAINELRNGADTKYFSSYFKLYQHKHKSIVFDGGFSPVNLQLLESSPPFSFYVSLSPTAMTPDITLHGLTPLLCQSPKNVWFANISHVSAKIGWSPPATGNVPTGYDLYYSLNSVKPTATTIPSINITDTQTVVNGLNPTTWYYAWVRSKSSVANASSVWTLIDSFRTLCVPTPVPTVTEQFNSRFIPDCWGIESGTLSSPSQLNLIDTSYTGRDKWFLDDYRNIFNSTNKSAALQYTNDTFSTWLLTPVYDLGTSGNVKSLEFDMALTQFSNSQQGTFAPDDAFAVVISTDGGFTWSGTNTLQSWYYGGLSIPGSGSHYSFPLNSYSGLVRFGFYAQNLVNNSGPEIYIDNVKVSQILPVTLLDFSGKKDGTANLLTWRTATEQNNRGFELQRSANGTDFGRITFVPTKASGGNSTSELSYAYKDKKPLIGNNYYRLKQTDADGKATLSNVVLIKNGESQALQLMALYPNPTSQILNIVMEAPAAQKVQLTIADVAGKTVQQQTLDLQKGSNAKTLNVSALQKGTYIVKIICAAGCEDAVRKFVKE